MNDYRQIKNRLSKEEQEGMNDLLARLRLKREQAIKVKHDDRDEEGHRTVQE